MILDKHQSLIDAALLECGSLEAAFDVALTNGFAISDDVAPGTDLITPAVADARVVRYYQETGRKPVTGVIDNEALAGEGLEFWGLEIDFIIN